VVDRIVRSAHRIDFLGRTMPDLTTEVNSLLAMDPQKVLLALGDALDRFRRQGMVRDDYRVTLETLTALLVGITFKPDESWQAGATLHVHHGFVLASFLNDGTFFSGADQWTEPPPLEVYTKDSTALRRPLVPDGAALIRTICGPAEMPIPFRDDRNLRVSAGLALGYAARSDPALAERILREASRTRDRIRRLEVLCFALGRLATPDAEKALEKKFLDTAASSDRDPFNLLVEASRAGLPEEFLGRMWLRLPKTVPDAVGDFEYAAAGEVVVKARLAAALADRTDERLDELGKSTLGQAVSSLSVETFVAVLDVGLEAESADILTRLLWPMERGDAQSGGYPDPVAQARRFREGLGERRITLRPDELPSPGIYAEVVSASPPLETLDGGPPDFGIRLSAEIVGEEIRITVRNDGHRPCALNPAAFEYASLELMRSDWKQGDPWDPEETVPHLWLGRVATGMNPTVQAFNLLLLPPGESRSYTWPLGSDFPKDKRVYVGLQDGFSVEGDLPAPLLRGSHAARAR
jgi:hypothetical protein